MSEEDAKRRYEEVAGRITDGYHVVASKMFGMPTLKVGGKAFGGLFKDGMSFKLDEASIEIGSKLPGATGFDPSGIGRPMKGWLLVGFESNQEWQSLAEKALHHVSEANRPH